MRKFLVSKSILPSAIIGFVVGCNALRALRILSGIFLLSVNGGEFHTATHVATSTNSVPLRIDSHAALGSWASLSHSNYTGNEDGDSYKKQRVLCWIMTNPANHKTKAKAVKDTWAKRCDVSLFMSSKRDKDLPTVKLNVREGRNQLWGKTREALRFIWSLYKDQIDWFFKADDDTFAVVENLRYFLTRYNTSMPYWFGHRFQYSADSPDFFSGGAGYVLSREALRRFVEVAYSDGKICRQDHGTSAEDVEISRCMKNLNVTFMDTRDSLGRERFFPLIPGLYMSPNALKPDDWFKVANYYPPFEPGLNCCSDTAITFHYVEPDQMYLLNYLIYKLRPHGAKREIRPAIPEPPPDLHLNATPYWQLRKKKS